jgi:hypothetical protein
MIRRTDTMKTYLLPEPKTVEPQGSRRENGRTQKVVASGILPDVEGGFQPPGISVRSDGTPVITKARSRRAVSPAGLKPDSTAGKMPAATMTAKQRRAEASRR